jgi:hypothetical protein
MPPLDGDDRPLERRHAHDVEARDALTAQLALVRLARRAVARGLALRLEPRLVRRADLGRAERAGRVLLVREQQERDAEDLWRAQDRVWACLRVSGGSMGEGGRGRRTEDLPALAEPLGVGRVEDVEDGVAVGVVPRPDGADAALPAEVDELQDRRGQGDLPHCVRLSVRQTRSRG